MRSDYFDVFDEIDDAYDDGLDIEEPEADPVGPTSPAFGREVLLTADDLTDGLRSVLSEDYAGATDEEMDDALLRVLDEMSPAESFNVASALGQIGNTGGRALSDPNIAGIAQTVLPLVGGAVGTAYGGPGGAALGAQLGRAAAGALPTTRPMVGVPAAQAAPPASMGLTPSVGAGSTAAAQALVLARQPQILQSLLATALGEHGRQQVAGVPVAQLLGMLSQVVGQAAADADELMYSSQAWQSESVPDSSPADQGDRVIYASLLEAQRREFEDACDFEGGGW